MSAANANNAGSSKKPSLLSKAKSWADVDNDDFFAQVAQDRPRVSPNTPSWRPSPSSQQQPEKNAGGVPWSFPNPVPQQEQQQQQGPQGSPAGNGMGARFESLSPNTRRSAPLGNWRR